MTLDAGTRILAAIDDSPAAAPVLAAAGTMASLLDATVDAFHVQEADKNTAAAVASHAGADLRVVEGDPATEITRAAADPSVLLVVVGTRGQPAGARPAGHITCTTLQQIDKPVLVVPPDLAVRDPERPIRRALFPLEGTEQSSSAVADTLQRLASAGVELIAVHVFDTATTPAFWDQPAHAGQSWASQFTNRWCSGPDIDLHLRRGSPAETVIEIADEQQVDLIALGWSRDMSPGRAAVVQAALAKARVPVLLIPIPQATALSP